MRDIQRFALWACLLPLLVIAATALRDLSAAFFDQRKLADAAFEGTKFGRAYGYDVAKITEAARAATTLPEIMVSPLRPCGCTTSEGIMLAQCDAACPGGGWSQPYIVVAVSMCFRPLLNWPGLSYCHSGDSQCAAAGCTSRQILLSGQSVEPQ